MSHVSPYTYDKEEKAAATTYSDIRLTKLDEMDDVDDEMALLLNILLIWYMIISNSNV